MREGVTHLFSFFDANGGFFRSIKVPFFGFIWLQTYEAPFGEGSNWTVLDQSGRVVGVVRTPERLSLFEIGQDYLLGKRTDGFNQEAFVVYALHRDGAIDPGMNPFCSR